MNFTEDNESNIFLRVKDILNAAEILVRHRKLFVVLFITIISIFVIYILVAKPVYHAEASLLPENAREASSLQSMILAAGGIPGISLGPSSSNSRLYKPILLSRTVLLKIIYNDYLIKNMKSGRSFFDLFDISGNDSNELLENALLFLRNKIEIDNEINTGMTIISIETFNPELSSMIINALVYELDAFLKHIGRKKAEESKNFIIGRLDETKGLLSASEESLKKFREDNKRIEKSPQLNLEQGRLMREVRIQEEVYLTLKKELEITKIEEVKNLKVVNTLDVAVPSVFKSNPKRLRILVFGIIISLSVSTITVFLKNYFVNVLSDNKYRIIFNKITNPFKSDIAELAHLLGFGRKQDDDQSQSL